MRHRLPVAMQVLAAMLAFLVLIVPRVAPSARHAEPYGTPVGDPTPPYGTTLYDDDGTFEFWGGTPDWAEEQQVGFTLPDGGPWTLWLVRIWMSGTLPQQLVLRDAPLSVWNAPSEIIDDSILFTPGYASPPDRWVEVNVMDLGLVLPGGQEIFIGVALNGADAAIGLDSPVGGGHSWGFVDGAWENDTYEWMTHAAVRLVLSDTSFDPEITTWGTIKALFEAQNGGTTVVPSSATAP